jgi:F0F1-type ATP synthase assembly protein I
MAKKPWPVLVGEYTSLAFLLPVSAVLGYAIGYLIDQQFATTWIRIAGLLVGIAAGLVQLIRQLMSDTKDDPE